MLQILASGSSSSQTSDDCRFIIESLLHVVIIGMTENWSYACNEFFPLLLMQSGAINTEINVDSVEQAATAVGPEIIFSVRL